MNASHAIMANASPANIAWLYADHLTDLQHRYAKTQVHRRVRMDDLHHIRPDA